LPNAAVLAVASNFRDHSREISFVAVCTVEKSRASRRQRMAGVDFDKFGGKGGGFTPVEQVQLKEAMRDALAFSALAVASAESGFANKRDLLKTWFGGNGPATVTAVAAGVKKMHRFLSDSTRLVRFVDARGQSEKIYSSQQVPAPGPAGSASHGATVTVRSAPTVIPMGAGDYAYVKCLSEKNASEPAAMHTGSGMRVYIGERGFHSSKSLKDRSMTVYHELTHKILGTIDYDANGGLVYGVPACKALAMSDPQQALKHADCWCYFAASFKYTL
jgi:hypothetical protein